jgi:hypothetical protein
MNELSAQILDKAADHVLEKGWSNNSNSILWRDKTCVAVAIGHSARMLGHTGFGRIAQEAMGDLRVVIDTDRIVWWNDYKCSGQEEAVSVLRQAAEIARNG